MGYPSDLGTEDRGDARRAADWARAHASVIRTALAVYAERMQEAADQARHAYQAGQDDPQIKAAQDASLLTSNGLKNSIRLFLEASASARVALDAMDAAPEHDACTEPHRTDDGYADCDGRPL